MTIPKRLWCVARTRGTRTQYFYGYKLKDIFARLKKGDVFAFVKYEHGGERIGRFLGKTWAEEV